jgi:hypothetical protein
MANEIKRAVKDIGDAAKEGWHRGSAEAEHDKRTEFGDVMTPGEKAGSMVNEAKENAKAGVDRTKRELRDL